MNIGQAAKQSGCSAMMFRSFVWLGLVGRGVRTESG